MIDLPERISTTKELDEVLSRPSEALIDSMRSLKGDIMILGAGGKIGMNTMLFFPKPYVRIANSHPLRNPLRVIIIGFHLINI